MIAFAMLPRSAKPSSGAPKAPITIAKTNATFVNLLAASNARKATLKQAGSATHQDLLDQLCVRATFLSSKTIRTEKSALVEKLHEMDDAETTPDDPANDDRTDAGTRSRSRA